MVQLLHNTVYENVLDIKRYLVIGEGVPEVSSSDGLSEEQILVAREHFGEVIVVPLVYGDKRLVQFTGHFVYCSDSRYAKCFNDVPLKLYGSVG